MSPGGLHGNMWYAIFLLSSLLFIYYILSILSHSSHRMLHPCQSKLCGCLQFWGLILIGNCCGGHCGMGQIEEEQRREGRNRKRQEADWQTERWQHNKSKMRNYVKKNKKKQTSQLLILMCPRLHNTFFFMWRPGSVNACIEGQGQRSFSQQRSERKLCFTRWCAERSGQTT